MRCVMASWVLCVLFGVCGADAADSPKPDTSKIIQVIGRFSAAHACPVAEDKVLTNAHVVDERPFDMQVSPFPIRFSQGATEGYLEPVWVSSHEDAAGVTPKDGLKVDFYPVATHAPAPGDRVWWVGYDWRKRDQGFQERVFEGKVLRVVAGNLILDQSTPPGSSGSCVLNAYGEVVGIIAWGFSTEDSRSVAVAVGVYGRWWVSPARREEAPPAAPLPSPAPPNPQTPVSPEPGL